VYLLAAPGQRAMLQAVEHLPPEAVELPASRSTCACGRSPTWPTISPPFEDLHRLASPGAFLIRAAHN
jgi:hypothetical protein